jgi:hypothetical protein
MSMRPLLLDNERRPTSIVGWLMGTERGSFTLFLATVLFVVGMLLSGCAPPRSVGAAAPVAAAGDAVVVQGGRALIFANLAYQTAGTAAALGIENGWIKGNAKVSIQAASQRAVDALADGERAVSAADKAASAARALAAVGDLCALHPLIKAACDRAK